MSTVSHEDVATPCRGPDPPQPQRALMVSSGRQQLHSPSSGPRQAQSSEHPQPWHPVSNRVAVSASVPCTPTRKTIARTISNALPEIDIILRVPLIIRTTFVDILQESGFGFLLECALHTGRVVGSEP